MPTFKALTQRNTYGYFYFRRASASYLLVGSDPTVYANFMSAMAVRDFNVFTDNPRIKTYNGIPQKPGYHKPVKPSRALRRLLTAFRYEVFQSTLPRGERRYSYSFATPPTNENSI